MTEDLSRLLVARLSECPDHGNRGAGNLTVRARHGKDERRRMLDCRSCKCRLSGRTIGPGG